MKLHAGRRGGSGLLHRDIVQQGRRASSVPAATEHTHPAGRLAQWLERQAAHWKVTGSILAPVTAGVGGNPGLCLSISVSLPLSLPSSFPISKKKSVGKQPRVRVEKEAAPGMASTRRFGSGGNLLGDCLPPSPCSVCLGGFSPESLHLGNLKTKQQKQNKTRPGQAAQWERGSCASRKLLFLTCKCRAVGRPGSALPASRRTARSLNEGINASALPGAGGGGWLGSRDQCSDAVSSCLLFPSVAAAAAVTLWAGTAGPTRARAGSRAPSAPRTPPSAPPSPTHPHPHPVSHPHPHTPAESGSKVAPELGVARRLFSFCEGEPAGLAAETRVLLRRP